MNIKDLNSEQQVFCLMTGYELFGKSFRMDPKIDWDKVYQEVTYQSVSCIFSDICQKLPADSAIRKKWEMQNFSIMANGIQVRYGQQKLIRLLEDHQIPFVILKGTAAAYYYPNPDYRAMGDIDLMVREEDFPAVVTLLEQNGYCHTHDHEDNARHESFDKDGIHVECHRRFALQGRSNTEIIDSIISKGIVEDCVWREDSGGSFPMLSDERNGLVLLDHIAHHLESGLGMRQIMDWLAYVPQCLRDEQWDGTTGRYIRKSSLETLAKTVTRIGQIYFGLDESILWCKDADPETCRDLLQLVFSYGNFGKKDAVDNRVLTVMQHNQKSLWQNLKRAGEFNWKILHRFPWLRPIAPFYQMFRYTRQVFTTKGALKSMLHGSRKAKKRASLLERLGIR